MNPARTRANYFVLAGDPEVWGEQFHQGIKGGEPDNACCVCGKKTGGKKNTAFVLVSHRSTALPVSELPEEDFDEGSDTMGCFPIGSECKKKLPAKYVIAALPQF